MKIILKHDSRDFHAYQHFGQVPDLDTPVNFDDPNIIEKIQPVGNVQCVLYTGTYIAQNKTKKEYDIDELWSRVPKSPQGTDPRDVFKEIVKNGLQVKGTKNYEKPFSSFWRADSGSMDSFDNVRSSMLTVKGPVAIATYWHREWQNLPTGAVMPIGKTPLGGHMYADKGWAFGNVTSVNVKGEPMFIIEWWGGKTYLMPRETFNAAIKPYGMQAWVLSDSEIDAKRVKSLTETLKDLMINLVIKLRDMVKTYKVEPVVTSPIPEPPQPLPEPSIREKIYKEARKSLGIDVSPSDSAPDDLACVESLCQVLKKVGIEVPPTLSTLTFYTWLKKSPKFIQTTENKPGNIIISPTGKGNGSIPHGHVGILGEAGWILSNDSATGMWLENYTLQKWVDRFRTKGGYPILFFEAIKGP